MCAPAIAAASAAISSMSASTMFAVSLGVSALSTGMQYISQQQQAEARVEAQEANMAAQAEAANNAMVRTSSDLQQREQQERAATALRIHNAKIEANKAASTANATSESAGLSVEALMSDYERQYASYADSQMQQLGFNVDQIDRQREAAQARAESRVNSMPRTPVQSPSLLGAGIDLAGSAMGSFQAFSTRDPSTGEYTLE